MHASVLYVMFWYFEDNRELWCCEIHCSSPNICFQQETDAKRFPWQKGNVNKEKGDVNKRKKLYNTDKETVHKETTRNYQVRA